MHYNIMGKCSVKIMKYSQDIIMNENKLNDSNYLTNFIYYNNDSRQYGLSDQTWFIGNILNFTLTGCNECNNKIKVINHL